MLLIFVHERGHFLAARQRGLNVGAPTFIPFVGAWIELKDLPHDVETEAWVGLAGPLLGSVGALACYYAYRATDEPDSAFEGFGGEGGEREILVAPADLEAARALLSED